MECGKFLVASDGLAIDKDLRHGSAGGGLHEPRSLPVIEVDTDFRVLLINARKQPFRHHTVGADTGRVHFNFRHPNPLIA